MEGKQLMRPSYSHPSFITSPEGVSWDKGLENTRRNPIFVQRTAPQGNAERGGSSACGICVHLRPSVVLFCLGAATTRENCGLGSTKRPSQINCSASEHTTTKT